MKNSIELNASEIRSGLSRVKFAEGLISKLPESHDGRNTWLLNYGVGKEAQRLRSERNLKFNETTESCETVSTGSGNE